MKVSLSSRAAFVGRKGVSVWTRPLLVGAALLGLGSIAQAQQGSYKQRVEDDLVSKALECRLTEDRMTRLLCFDSLFRTPMEPRTPEVTGPPIRPVRSRGPLRTTTELIESQRTPGNDGWVLRVRPWYETSLLTHEDFESVLSNGASRHGTTNWSREAVDVYLTMKETGAGPASPGESPAFLTVACENDITILGVLLPKPIATLQANLSLSNSRGTVLRVNWRDVENGDVVIAGRGLESIDTIKTIGNFEQVKVQVTYPDGPRELVFDIGDLKDRLKPLRSACHW